HTRFSRDWSSDVCSSDLVYDLIHIGNARPLIFFDVVRRYLQQFYEVTYAVNFTDVDDKLIRRSEETGTPVPELAEKNISDFLTEIGRASCRERVSRSSVV